MEETTVATILIEDDGATVTGIGELDLRVGGQFDDALAEVAGSGKPATVDFRKADFIDSAILQSLVAHGRTLHEEGNRLKILVALGSYPQYVLKTVGFDCLMDIIVEPSDAAG